MPDGPHGPQHIDAVLLSGTPEASARPLLTEAADGGVPVVHVVDPEAAASDVPPEPLASVRVGAAADLDGPWGRPTVDLARLNPLRFRRACRTSAVAASLAPGPDHLRACADLADLAAAAGVPIDPVPDESVVTAPTALADRLGVLDAPALHADAASHATWLASVAATGTPIVCTELPPAVAERLGLDLAAALTSATMADLLDVDARERTSVRQRCAAYREHGAPRAWAAIAHALGMHPAPEPTISVLAATNRPDHLDHLIGEYRRFAYPRRELVLALHGDAFTDDVEDGLRDQVDTPLTIVRVEQNATLGDVMNRATDAASGQLLTKMDDDDLYDRDHLTDLITALRYSGATVVAKGSEFVYLAELDITIRRMPLGAESRSRSVAGGTLMISRDDLHQVGRWQRAPRSIDQLLIGDVLAAGGNHHRTHGHGFVLNRHGRGHTWDSGVDYFLQQAERQWPGLALDAAGFSDTSGTLP